MAAQFAAVFFDPFASRILIPFTLMVAVLAGIGIEAVCSRGSAAALATSALLVIIGAVDMLIVGLLT